MRECECLHSNADDVSSTANLVLIVCLLPALSLLGVFFNILSLLVFCEQRGTASKYLAALSCSDVGVCMAGVLVISSDSLRAHSFLVDQIFVFLLPKIIPLGLFFQMLSVYITVLAAFDCFVSVRSGEAAVECRGVWAPRVLAAVVLFVAMYNVIQFGDLQAVECLHPDNYTLYELCPTELRVSETYVVVYKGYMYALSMAIIPFLLLSLLTAGILLQIRKNGGGEDNSATVLLLVIALFLACNLTSLLVNIFEMLRVPLGEALEGFLIDVGNLLVVVNATANFFIYWNSSPAYRSAILRRCRLLRRAGDVSATKVDFV